MSCLGQLERRKGRELLAAQFALQQGRQCLRRGLRKFAKLLRQYIVLYSENDQVVHKVEGNAWVRNYRVRTLQVTIQCMGMEGMHELPAQASRSPAPAVRRSEALTPTGTARR